MKKCQTRWRARCLLWWRTYHEKVWRVYREFFATTWKPVNVNGESAVNDMKLKENLKAHQCIIFASSASRFSLSLTITQVPLLLLWGLLLLAWDASKDYTNTFVNTDAISNLFIHTNRGIPRGSSHINTSTESVHRQKTRAYFKFLLRTVGETHREWNKQINK